jgi:hypothetical protein
MSVPEADRQDGLTPWERFEDVAKRLLLCTRRGRSGEAGRTRSNEAW